MLRSDWAPSFCWNLESSPMWILGLIDSERVEKDYLEETMWLEAPESIMYVEDGERVAFKAWHLSASSVDTSSLGFFALGGEMLCYLRRVDISSSCFLIQCSSRWYPVSQYRHSFFSNFLFLEPKAPLKYCWFGLGFESAYFSSFFFDFPFAFSLEELVTERAWSSEV